VTEAATFEVDADGLHLVEVAGSFDLGWVELDTHAPFTTRLGVAA
jgi:acyl CoA:acetate/3-ketoacid CoA transferase